MTALGSFGIISTFCDFSTLCSQENFARNFQTAPHWRTKTVPAQRGRWFILAAHQPPAGAPDVVGSRLPSPYQLRARIQSFQAIAAPFPGDFLSPSSRTSHGRPRRASESRSAVARRGSMRSQVRRQGPQPSGQSRSDRSWSGSRNGRRRRITIA